MFDQLIVHKESKLPNSGAFFLPSDLLTEAHNAGYATKIFMFAVFNRI